jgi:hypothetical protein
MPEFRTSIDARLRDEAVRCRRGRERFLPCLLLVGLVRAGAALAGEQAATVNVKIDSAAPVNFGVFSPATPLVTASPGVFTMPTSGGIPVFSTTEFRPRKHTIFDRDPAVSAFSDAPMLHYATVWQRLSEYKSKDRVRLLTLWESSGSSVSLQAGKRGEPSLQWSSRLMNRGGSTRGLLDRFFSVSLAGAANGFRNSTRSASMSAVSSKPASPAVVAALN